MNTLKEIADLARSINNIKAAAVAVYNENMFSEKGGEYANILSKSNIIK